MGKHERPTFQEERQRMHSTRAGDSIGVTGFDKREHALGGAANGGESDETVGDIDLRWRRDKGRRYSQQHMELAQHTHLRVGMRLKQRQQAIERCPYGAAFARGQVCTELLESRS